MSCCWRQNVFLVGCLLLLGCAIYRGTGWRKWDEKCEKSCLQTLCRRLRHRLQASSARFEKTHRSDQVEGWRTWKTLSMTVVNNTKQIARELLSSTRIYFSSSTPMTALFRVGMKIKFFVVKTFQFYYMCSREWEDRRGGSWMLFLISTKEKKYKKSIWENWKLPLKAFLLLLSHIMNAECSEFEVNSISGVECEGVVEGFDWNNFVYCEIVTRFTTYSFFAYVKFQASHRCCVLSPDGLRGKPLTLQKMKKSWLSWFSSFAFLFSKSQTHFLTSIDWRGF